MKWPCFYGIDFASRAELIANGLDVEGIRASIGADSLGYVSLDGLVAATEQPQHPAVPRLLRRRLPDRAARACVGKHVLEGIEKSRAVDRPRAASTLGLRPPTDALTRP